MKKLILSLMIILSTMATVNADTGVFTFIPPTEREDSSALLPSEIAGYEVWVNGVKDTVVSPLESAATGFTLDLLSGEYIITVVTLDTEARKSAHSIPVELSVPFDPKPPTNLGVTITININ